MDAFLNSITFWKTTSNTFALYNEITIKTAQSHIWLSLPAQCIYSVKYLHTNRVLKTCFSFIVICSVKRMQKGNIGKMHQYTNANWNAKGIQLLLFSIAFRIVLHSPPKCRAYSSFVSVPVLSEKSTPPLWVCLFYQRRCTLSV